MRKRHKLAVSVMAWAVALASLPPIAAATGFDDLPGDGFNAVILHITGLGIMDGCGGDFFCPYELVTREDMAVWLERVHHYAGEGSHYTPPDPTTGTFDDVPLQSCRASWIEDFSHDGITAGCYYDSDLSYRLYCPRTIVSRAEMAVFLVATEHLEDEDPFDLPHCTGVFDDVPCPDGFAVDWIEQLDAEGITVGCNLEPPLFCPYGTVTREQMAAFLTQVLSNRYCNNPEHPNDNYPETCWNPSGPETGPDVVTVTLDSNSDGHELLPQ